MSENNKAYFIIDSHRGVFKSGLLENSIPAFEESYYEGANCVECDIRLTKDNKIVLLHNNTIDHITSFAEKIPKISEFNEEPTGKIREHTLAYLKAMKFPNNANILTLSEFLKILKKYKFGAQIELKESGYEDLILKEIEQAKINYKEHTAPIVCTSFNWFAVKRLIKKAKNYNIPLYSSSGNIGLCIGMQGIPLGIPLYGKYMMNRFQKLNVWGGMTYYKNMSVKLLDYAHKKGFKFCPRIPNDKKLAISYLKAGVDGFETDNISFIRECVKESGRGNELMPIPKRD